METENKFEKFNRLWSPKLGREITEAEYNAALVKYPELWTSYYLMDLVIHELQNAK